LSYRPRWAEQFDGPRDEPSPYSYGAGEPPAGWRPFANSSPWNTQAATTPTADSGAVVAYLNGVGKPTKRFIGVGGTSSDFEHPVYYYAAGDPYLRVKIQAGSKDPSMSQTADANIANAKKRVSPIQNRFVPMPTAAKPAGSGGEADAHIAIVTATKSYEMWQAKKWTPGEERYGCKSGAVFDLNGIGLSESGHSATASGASLLAGQVRRCELEAGEINHALAMTVKYVRAGVFDSATSNGSALKDPGVTAGDAEDLKRPITGCRFRLNYTWPEIEGLSIPKDHKTFGKAMSKYGLIPIDTGGSSWGFQLEAGVVDVAYGKTDRWSAYCAANGYSSAVGSGGPAGSYLLDIQESFDWSRLQVVAQ
jgi:hypothetical protein